MADLARLVVEVDSSGVVSAGRNLDEFKTKAKETETATGSFKEHWEGAMKSIQDTLFPLLLAKEAFSQVTEAVGEMIHAYTEAEQANIKLDAVYRATGASVGLTRTALTDLSEELSNHSLVDVEVVKNAEALMLTFKSVRSEGFEPAMKAAMDLSATFGMDLQSATVMLGKALEDPITGLTSLRRVGVSFTDSEEAMIKAMNAANDSAGAHAEILKVVNGQVAGVAETMSTSATGSVIKLKQAWEDLQKSMGKNFVEASKPTLDWLTETMDNLSGKTMSVLTAMEGIKGKDNTLKVMGELSTDELTKLLSEAIKFRDDINGGAGFSKWAKDNGFAIGPNALTGDVSRVIDDAYMQLQIRKAKTELLKPSKPEPVPPGNITPFYFPYDYSVLGAGVGDDYSGEDYVEKLKRKGAYRGSTNNLGPYQNSFDFHSPDHSYADSNSSGTGELGTSGWSDPINRLDHSDTIGNPPAKQASALDLALQGVAKSLATIAAQDAVTMFTDIGNAMASGADASGALGDMALKMLDQLPMLLLQAGLNAMLLGPTSPTFWMGLAMVAASGVTAFVDGKAHGAITSAQKATEGTTSATKTVNDAIITKDGQVINTHPDDNLYAFKALPGGGKGGGSSVVVHNYSGAQVQTQEKTGANGQRELILMIGQAVNQHIADGRADRVAGARWGVGFGGRSAS